MNTIGDKAEMNRKQAAGKKQEYEEMERSRITPAFRRPPWHLTAVRMKRKEKEDDVRKKKDGEAHVGDMGAGRSGVKGDRGSGA